MKYLFPKISGFIRDDHSLYIDVKNMQGKSQSILIDCGNNHTLSVKDLIRLKTVLISHTHMDHLIGFDNIIRMNLREDKRIRLMGPSPISQIIHHRLQGYTWNLIQNSPFEIEVWDISARTIKKYLFKCCDGFRKKYYLSKTSAENPIFKNDLFSCSHIRLNHGIPVIGYSLKESDCVRIDKKKLKQYGLSGGQWIKKLKTKDFDSSDIYKTDNKTYSFKELHEKLIIYQNGYKISYITDTILNDRLKEKIVGFVKNSDELYCETTFLNKDLDLAQEYYHLTAKQTGQIAKQAKVKQLYPIHFSLRYHTPKTLLKEVQTEFPDAKLPDFSKKCLLAKKI